MNSTWRLSGEQKRGDWLTLVKGCVKQREKERWWQGMQKKPKLRLYRVLKVGWGREEYLDLSTEQRALIAELRCGTNRLRMETGRWQHEEWEECICMLCGSRQVEDERHILLKCPIYANFRESLFQNIAGATGYQFALMAGDDEWMLSACLGCAVGDKPARLKIYGFVAKYLRVAYRVRTELTKICKEVRASRRMNLLGLDP